MPQQPSWTARISLILKELSELSSPALNRREVETLFNIGRSQADSLMSKAGCTTEMVGGVTVKTIRREALLNYLKFSNEGTAALQEHERKVKLAQKLNQAKEDLVLREIRIPMNPGDEWIQFKDLPNVKVEGAGPFTLRVEFDNLTDLAHTLMCFTKALANDWATFERQMERKAG